MSWLKRIFNLEEHDRQSIAKYFGSFHANTLALGQHTALTEGYENNVDVYSIITTIKDAATSVSTIIERRVGDSWEPVTDSSLNDLIANPNRTKGYTWTDINEQILIYLLASGNAYPVGMRGLGSRIDELDVLPSQQVEIEMINQSWLMPEYRYKAMLNSQTLSFDKEEVGHIKYFNPVYHNTKESLIGLSPIQVACEIVNIGNKSLNAESNLVENRGAIGLISDGSQMPMSPDEAEQVQQGFDRRATGTHNKGKVIVTNKDLKFIQMAMSPQDLELLKNRVVNMRSMCNVYGVNSTLFNDPDNKTFNNTKEAEKSFWTRGVIPVNNRIESMYQRWLLPTHLDERTHRIRFDYSDVEALQEDFHSKVKSYSMMKTSGIISANTAALALGQPESDDENANKLIVSTTNVPLEDLSNQPIQPNNTPDDTV